MAVLAVPALDDEPWPTLGPQVVAWLNEYGVYGPGEKAGEPYEVTPDFEAFLWRAYEVYPQGHKSQGRRRFKRCYLEERKGTAKTEKAMLLALAECHPTAPVRCDGFDANGDPVGVGVLHPYIPLVSYSVEQTEDLGYNVLRFIIQNSELASDFDVGMERILLTDHGREAGKIVALSGSPNARDGARTTFQHFDEPHRMHLQRLIRAHSTMVENTYKRVGADPWTFYTSTAGDPNEESVARDMRRYAESVDKGEVDDPRLWFFSRHATSGRSMETPDDVRDYLLEASGPNASWSGDIDGLVARWFEPNTDRQYYRRVWGNEWVAGGDRAFDVAAWNGLADATHVVPDGALIVLGFDGSRFNDHTALVGVEVETGHVFTVGHWTPPADGSGIEESDVDRVVAQAFDRWSVWRLYGDPPRWEASLDRWKGKFGDKQVVDWHTARWRQMAAACRLFNKAIADGDLSHDGSTALSTHVGNCYRHDEDAFDEDELPLWTIRKERKDSPDKIDLAVCAIIAWEARGDAIAFGATAPKRSKARAYFL